MRTLIIPADGSEVRWDDPDKIDLAYLQGIVGGYIEAIDVGDEISMYLNEEGKLMGMHRNERATRLAKKFSGIGLTDYIVGTIVLVGAVDEDGNETGLTTRAKAFLEMELGDG